MRKLLLILAGAVLVLTACGGRTVATPNEKSKTENISATVNLTKSDFLAKVVDYETNSEEWIYKGDKPAIIDFYASWCKPCKDIAPTLEQLAVEYKDRIHVYKIDVDQEQELAAMFGIRSIPTLLFIPMEGQPQVAQGGLPKDEFVRIIDEILLN